MSKYKYKFGVSTNADEIDLVDDLRYSEEELDEMSDYEFHCEMIRITEEYAANAVEIWANPIEDSRDW